MENITVIGLSADRDPEPADVFSNCDHHTIDLAGYIAVDIIVMLGSDNPSLLTIELQETISCGKTRRSSRVMPRSIQDDY